jgi:hypothetical protein
VRGHFNAFTSEDSGVQAQGLIKDPAQAGPFRSLNRREIYEAVHVVAIGKEPDDSAIIVDPVDESALHPECWLLRRTLGIVNVEIRGVEDKTMCIPLVIGERSDDPSLVIAAERRNTRSSHPRERERVELCEALRSKKHGETVIGALGIRPKAAH